MINELELRAVRVAEPETLNSHKPFAGRVRVELILVRVIVTL